MPTQNKSVMAFNLIWLYEKTDLMHQLVGEIKALHLPPPLIGHTYAFQELPKALDVFLGGQTTGKVVVLV
jgi:alcohol dehydrogenase